MIRVDDGLAVDGFDFGFCGFGRDAHFGLGVTGFEVVTIGAGLGLGLTVEDECVGLVVVLDIGVAVTGFLVTGFLVTGLFVGALVIGCLLGGNVGDTVTGLEEGATVGAFASVYPIC